MREVRALQEHFCAESESESETRYGFTRDTTSTEERAKPAFDKSIKISNLEKSCVCV